MSLTTRWHPTRKANVRNNTRPRGYRAESPSAKPTAVAGPTYEIGFVKIRYKLPKSDTSRLISTPIDGRTAVRSFEAAPRDARFATAVAGFAELLRGGRYTGSLSYDDVLRIANASRGPDEFGYRSEFLELVRAAKNARTMAQLER